MRPPAGGGWKVAGEHISFTGGKSGLHRTGRSLTATRGDPRESAAEKTPPMVLASPEEEDTGKVEIVG
jgi:hypothetical protein